MRRGLVMLLILSVLGSSLAQAAHAAHDHATHDHGALDHAAQDHHTGVSLADGVSGDPLLLEETSSADRPCDLCAVAFLLDALQSGSNLTVADVADGPIRGPASLSLLAPLLLAHDRPPR